MTIPENNDIEEAMSGNAIYANRITITCFKNNTRLAFLERAHPKDQSRFRTAVILSNDDAFALYKALKTKFETQ